MQNSDSLKKKTLFGIGWNIIGQIGYQVLNISITIILARILAPEIFGLVAMVTIFTGYANILINFGFSIAIIQKKELSQLALNSMFWTTVGIGIIVFLITCLLSPFIAKLYDDERLILITIAIASSFIFSALNVVQDALFVRDLDFKSLTIRKMGALFISGLVAIPLAVWGFSYWSLVAQKVSVVVATTFFLWSLSKWRPKFEFSFSALKSVFNLSGSIFVNSTFSYFANNFDNYYIGKYFSPFDLGIYSKSFSLISLPTTNISQVLTSVLLPAFSKIQDEKSKVGGYYLNITKFILFITIPLMIVVFLASEPIILLLFGEKWVAAAPFFRIFSFSGILASYNTLTGTVVISQGRDDLINLGTILKRPSVVVGILIGSTFGVMGIAVGKLCADCFNTGVTLHQINKAVALKKRQQLINMLPPIMFSAIAYLGFYLLTGSFFLSGSFTIRSILLLLFYIGFYLALVFIFEKRFIQQIAKTINER